MATAVLESSTAEVSSMGLPMLPSALFYGVWAELEAAEDEAPAAEAPGGHVHSQSAGDESGGEGHAVRSVFVGRLDPSGALAVDLGAFIASASALEICIEADQGALSPSPSCVLRGRVALPSGAAEGTPEHVH